METDTIPDPPSATYNLALTLGIIAAIVDLFVPPVQVSHALIVVFAFTLSLAYPHHAWQWALLIGIFLPVAFVTAKVAGYVNPNRPDSVYLAYFSLLPAFIGAYTAVLLRKVTALRRSD